MILAVNLGVNLPIKQLNEQLLKNTLNFFSFRLMVQLTLPEETLVYTNRFKLPANVEMEKYKADLKRAAVDTVFLTAFLKQIKSLIGKVMSLNLTSYSSE